MKIIDKLTRWNIHPTDADIGIEIEVEGHNLPQKRNLDGMWRVDTDGSLRGESYEYVTPPIKFDNLGKYLKKLQSAYDACHSEVYESIRTGVHVHLNVQQLTMRQFYNVVTLYFILEDLLVNWCGPSRVGNHFCLRSRDAEFVVFKLVASLKNFGALDTDVIRYSSLNLYSLFKYGTIEFRAMRGTANLDAIQLWTEVLYSLRNAALKYRDPVDIIMSMSGDGEEALLRNALPDHFHLFTDVPEYRTLIREGARRMQLLAHATDWSKLDDTKYQQEIRQVEIPRMRLEPVDVDQAIVFNWANAAQDNLDAIEEVLLELEEEGDDA